MKQQSIGGLTFDILTSQDEFPEVLARQTFGRNKTPQRQVIASLEVGEAVVIPFALPQFGKTPYESIRNMTLAETRTTGATYSLSRVATGDGALVVRTA